MKEIKRIAVVYNRDKPEAKKAAEKIRGWISLKPKGYKVHSTISWNVLENGLDAILVLGGDGSILHTANKVAKYYKEIPIVGINYGFRGYLCRIQPDEALKKIKRILQGDFEIEERTRIQAEIRKTENDELVETIDALNEIVIGGISKTVSLDITITDGDEIIEDFVRGDGVIIPTRTGSTGYNKNAGGIVIDKDDFVITANNPVSDDASQSWLTREKSVVFSTETVFEIHSRIKKKDNLPLVVGDSQNQYRLKNNEYVVVKKSLTKTLFIKFKN